MDPNLLRECRGNTRILHVVGIPRSGTTVLSVALNAHPDVVCLIEPFLSYLKSGSLRCPHDQDGEEELREPPHEVIAELSRRTDLQWVGFMETFRLPHHPLFPNDDFLRSNVREGSVDASVGIVRDPRDVWVSTLTRYEWSRRLPLKRDFTNSWNAYVEWAREAGIYQVRYEDLVEDPRRVLGGIARHLELEPREEMMRPPATAGMGDDRGEEGGEFFRISVGRYRDQLSSSAQAFIEAHCAPGMRSLGYTAGKRVGFVK